MTPHRGILSLLAVISATVIALLPTPVGAAQGDLLLVDQNFNIAADGSLTTTVALPANLADTDLSTATIAVTVYQRVEKRELLGAIIDGTLSPAGDTVTTSPTEWTVPQPGRIAFSVPLEIVAARPEALTISRAGLYPVVIALQRDGTTLTKVLTFLNRLPATTAGVAGIDPISVALAIGTRTAVHLDSKAITSLDPTAVEELTSLAAALEALQASAMRATVRLTPAVLAGIQQLDPALFARLIDLLPNHQIIGDPRWPLDPSAAASAGQESLYTSWLRSGEDLLAALVPTPISRSTIFVDQPISGEGATLQRNLGARMMVMTPRIYDGLEGTIGPFSDFTGQLIAADLPNGATFDSAVIDHTISDLLAHPLQTPVQTKIYVVANLLALQQGIETAAEIPQRHAVVIAAPDLGVPDAGLIGPIASLINQTPGLKPASLDDVSLRTDRVLIAGEERPVALPAVDGAALNRRVFTRAALDNEINDVASMLPDTDQRPADWRSLAELLPTTALDESDAQSLATDVRSELAAIRGAVQVPSAYTISLPGKRSTVRVRFVNNSNVPLAIKAVLSSPSGKLVFTNDDQTVVLAPLNPTEIEIGVEARSNGTSGVSLDVFTPNDVRLAPTVPLKFRVNALGVGNVMTAALFGLVLLWWLEHVRSVRRKRRQVPPATLPAS
jgi:hypothetical protein